MRLRSGGTERFELDAAALDGKKQRIVRKIAAEAAGAVHLRNEVQIRPAGLVALPNDDGCVALHHGRRLRCGHPVHRHVTVGDQLGGLTAGAGELAPDELRVEPRTGGGHPHARSGPADSAFYTGKITTAKFFAKNVLPRLTAEREIAANADLAVMQLSEEAF